MITLVGSTLTAADVMRKDVVVVGPESSLQEAMRLITDNHVTGLPVLDAKDRCIGLVSASDIMAFVEENEDSRTEGRQSGRYFNPDSHRWEEVGSGAFADDQYGETPVNEIMTRDVIAVAPGAPIQDIATLMLEKSVHRVLVVDDKQHLHGIISAIDFVRLVAEA